MLYLFQSKCLFLNIFLPHFIIKIYQEMQVTYAWGNIRSYVDGRKECHWGSLSTLHLRRGMWHQTVGAIRETRKQRQVNHFYISSTCHQHGEEGPKSPFWDYLISVWSLIYITNSNAWCFKIPFHFHSIMISIFQHRIHQNSMQRQVPVAINQL